MSVQLNVTRRSEVWLAAKSVAATTAAYYLALAWTGALPWAWLLALGQAAVFVGTLRHAVPLSAVWATVVVYFGVLIWTGAHGPLVFAVVAGTICAVALAWMDQDVRTEVER